MEINRKIEEVSSLLSNDGVILCPTDTIWGLSGSIFSKKAVDRIFEIKNRPRNKPLIVLVSNLGMLKEYIVDIHPRIETLFEYHEQPLTVIYQASKKMPAHLCTAEGTIGIRIVKNDFCQSLIEALGHPIVSTSANVSGDPFPKRYSEINPKLFNQVDHVVYSSESQEREGSPSVIATFDHKGELNFLRS